MFDELETEAIRNRVEFDMAQEATANQTHSQEELAKRIDHENLQLLDTIDRSISVLDLPSIFEEARSLITLNPDYKGLSLSWEKLRFVPEAQSTHQVKAGAMAINTPMELKALTGYAVFLKSDDELTHKLSKEQLKSYEWHESSIISVGPRVMGHKIHVGNILYIFVFQRGNSDRLEAPQLVVAPEKSQQPKGDPRNNLWELMMDPHWFDKSLSDRANLLLHRASVRKIIGSHMIGKSLPPGGVRSLPRIPELIRGNQYQVDRLNELFATEVEVGRFFKRNIGGGPYGKLAQAFAPESSVSIELYKQEVAQELESMILHNPFTRESTS